MKTKTKYQEQVTLIQIIEKQREFTEWIYVLRIISAVNNTKNIESFIAFLQSKNISVTEDNVRYIEHNTVDIAFRVSILSPREVEEDEMLCYINNLYK